MISALLAITFLGLCLFGVVRDIATLTIPNWLNATIALLAIPALALSGLSLEAIGWTLLSALVAFVVSVGLFFGRVFGGGDAKMIPAVVLWVGPAGIPAFLFGMAIAGGVLAAVILPARFAAPAGFASPTRWASLQRGVGVPYGVAITAGVFYAIPHAPMLASILAPFSA